MSCFRFLPALTVLMMISACEPTIEPETEKEEEKEEVPPVSSDPYADLKAYKALKTYVDRTAYPDFKLGTAIATGDFLKKLDLYDLAVANFDEMTPDNAMKYSSVVNDNGDMDFTHIVNFLNLAEKVGLSVYGHTLAWHSQQRPAYLNGLIADRTEQLPEGQETENVLLQLDFNDGNEPFMSWGNNSTQTVEDGVFKVSNPSAVKQWEAQFAQDFNPGFSKDVTYRLSFRVKGSSEGTLGSQLQVVDGYQSGGDFPNVQFGTEWKTVSIECTCTSSEASRLVFSFGEFAGDIYIDDFVFSYMSSHKLIQMSPEEKKAVLTAEMDRWIKGMMEVTATRVSVWDAVNESISGSDRDGDGYYELESSAWGSESNFYWQDYLGSEDYVRIVIAKAREYYAQYGGTKPLKLFINDYNLESDWDDNKKLKSLIHWIEVWESDGVTKIDGIGSQMHISYYENPSTQASKSEHIVKMLRLMTDTGKLVKISELDMGYVDKSGNTLTTSQLTDKQHREMADYYEFIVRKYLEIVPPAQQYGITHWCPLDAPDNSFWRKGEPVGLWDRNYNRKYAYAGMANGLAGE